MTDAKDLYLQLLKKSLMYSLYDEQTYVPITQPSGFLKRLIVSQFRRRGIQLMRALPFDRQAREEGRDWPPPLYAQTMIGLRRLDNLQFCTEDVLANDIPGDLIEVGAWRGGACILMRAILKVRGVHDRCVWVADSFKGLPPPDPERYPADTDSTRHQEKILVASLEEARSNFRRYGLLDEQVRFLKGWFRDTLQTLKDRRWAVIRLDGDMYESTMDGLVNLYPNLSTGGYIIIDDYGPIPACCQAVLDYRAAHGIREEVRPIDWSGVFWQRTE